jgi:helix-turn-helix protein
MVRRAIPEAWSLAAPAALLEAQLVAVDSALQRLLGPAVLNSPELAEAAGLAREAAEACDLGGRPLGAANAALPWPAEPHLALWSAATRLREHRGDGHIACLLAAGIDPCQAHVVQVAAGQAAAETQRRYRWWSEAEWHLAEDGLRTRGWLAADGSLSSAGRAERTQVERGTDELALRPWQTLGLEGSERLWRLLNDLSARIVEQGGIPLPNPSGLPWPPAWNAAAPAD